ncbi:hypothetical protein EXS62_01845 [Candidatus Kaiserbacteria bacterium]|nr:hypothetical protein [Candidatus Kaiserbacteria bacterium]
MHTYKNILQNGSAALFALVLLALLVASVPVVAHADEGDGFSFDYFVPNDTSGGNYYPDTVGNYYPDTVGNYYPDSTGNYYPDSYSSDYGSTGYGSTGYGSTGYGSTGYGSTGYSAYQPNYSRPNYSYPSYSYPSYNYPSNSNTTVIAPTDINTCTALNSCNDNSYRDNSVYAPTTIVTDSHNISTIDSHNVYNPYPVTTYTAPVAPAQTQTQTQTVYVSAPVAPTYTQTYTPPQQFCPAGTTGVYPNCSYPRVAQYNNPAITLSSLPYTGLELGTFGTIMYWGFLVLWCLLAAYLIAVKKVHYKVAAWFAGSTQTSAPVAPVSRTHSHIAPKAVAQSEWSGIDPFIASQINRA